MVSLLNDFACVLPAHCHSNSICHSLCTCIQLYEYSYVDPEYSEMENVSHTEYIEMVFLQCAFVHEYSNVVSMQNVCDKHCTNTALACHQWCQCNWLQHSFHTLEIYQYHQLQSQVSCYSLYVHSITNI